MARKKKTSWVDTLNFPPDVPISFNLPGFYAKNLTKAAKNQGLSEEELAENIVKNFLENPANISLRAGQRFICTRFHGIEVSVSSFEDGIIRLVDMSSGLLVSTVEFRHWEKTIETYGLTPIDREGPSKVSKPQAKSRKPNPAVVRGSGK